MPVLLAKKGIGKRTMCLKNKGFCKKPTTAAHDSNPLETSKETLFGAAGWCFAL